jgi:hypothetical protein
MKRSLLLSKVRKSSDKKTASPRRRRPSKKLAASLDALATTLPELPAAGPTAKGGGSSKPAAGVGMSESLERKRGLTKKREKVVKAETQRFGKNMAILSLAGAKAAPGAGGERETPARDGVWSALRKHLETTVGRNP